jgi:cytochrome c oxidase subunit II
MSSGYPPSVSYSSRDLDAHTERALRLPNAARLTALGCGAVLLLSSCATDYPQDVLSPAGDYARRADQLWNLTFRIAAAIFVVVEAVLVYAIVKYRHRPGRKAAQFHGNTRLEVALTAIPALILAGIAVPTVDAIFDLSGTPSDALEVKVVAHQFWWEFSYPEQEIKTANEMHIPTNRPVRVILEGAANDPVDGSSEVIHSFWVPRLSGTQDIVPGHTNYLLLEADEPGVYLGQCKEYCGLSHANMRLRVIAQAPGDFVAWVNEQSAPAQEDSLAAEGARLFSGEEGNLSQPCAACHTVDPAIDAQPAIGPNLAHFATRRTFAGAMFENNEANLRAWLAGPSDVKPGAKMPDLGLNAQQIDALIEYLQTLR